MTRWPVEPLTFSKKNPSRAIPRSTYIHPPSLAKIGQRTSEEIGNKQTDRQTDKQTNAARFIVWCSKWRSIPAVLVKSDCSKWVNKQNENTITMRGTFNCVTRCRSGVQAGFLRQRPGTIPGHDCVPNWYAGLGDYLNRYCIQQYQPRQVLGR